MRDPNRSLHIRRSFTRNHNLIPARSRPRASQVPHLSNYSLIGWTFGRGSVIWRIWPAVLLHTAFAALTVTLSMRRILVLAIPNVMLTVLGVVIGFVISYRASSGYDRYWLGRTCWSDVIRNSRTMSRLIWFHVPPLLSPKTSEEGASVFAKRSHGELVKAMNEKRIALDLVEGFAVALKHHIRGELGIYYEDLYYLIRPLHKPGRTIENINTFNDEDEELTPKPATTSAVPPFSSSKARTLSVSSEPAFVPSGPSTQLNIKGEPDPVIPPINAYGTFTRPNRKSTAPHTHPHHHHRRLKHSQSQASLLSQSSSSTDGSSRGGGSNGFSSSRDVLLLPSVLPSDNTYMAKVSSELIPFSGMANIIRRYFHSRRNVRSSSSSSSQGLLEAGPMPIVSGDEGEDVSQRQEYDSGGRRTGPGPRRRKHRWQGPIWTGSSYARRLPAVAGGGENLPLEVLRCLSEWLSVLESRGTVPGTTMGTMIGTIAAFEENLSALERTLTTPLPFVYSVHISTVWLYLFFLPFQLIDLFGYYTIPGVAIAAFIYLGFLAAGEEIEQPFGYDDNDLDLDLFCREVVHPEIEHLKSSHGFNVYLKPPGLVNTKRPHRRSMTAVEISNRAAADLAPDV